MGEKERTSGPQLPLDEIDQVSLQKLSELLPLRDRDLGPQEVKALIGSRGNDVTGVRTDRKRGKAWIMFEVEFLIDLD